jgi:hypothetical protein
MKRTCWLAEKQKDGQFYPTRKITCEVTGEMDTGTKVWTEISTGEQYFCFRLLGIYYFYKN